MSLPLGEFLTVWSILTVNILSPGPNVLNTMATAMGSGRPAGMGAAAGVGLGIGLWCLSMSLGVAALFALVPAARVALTLFAVGLLAWFATRYLRAAWAGFTRRGPGGMAANEGLTWHSGFRRSLLVNLLNPKALTTWLAILSIFPVARAGAGDIALLCAGACVLSFTIHSVYALAFSTPAAARVYLRHAWAISGGTGLFFLAFAASILADWVASGG